MGASLTGSGGSCRCQMPARQNTPLGRFTLRPWSCAHKADHEAIGQLTMKKNWSADSLLLKKRDLLLRVDSANSISETAALRSVFARLGSPNFERLLCGVFHCGCDDEERLLCFETGHSRREFFEA